MMFTKMKQEKQINFSILFLTLFSWLLAHKTGSESGWFSSSRPAGQDNTMDHRTMQFLWDSPRTMMHFCRPTIYVCTYDIGYMCAPKLLRYLSTANFIMILTTTENTRSLRSLRSEMCSAIFGSNMKFRKQGWKWSKSERVWFTEILLRLRNY